MSSFLLFYSYFTYWYFLFFMCNLSFQKSFQQSGDAGQAGTSSIRIRLSRYVRFSFLFLIFYLSIFFFSPCVCPISFQNNFQHSTAWWRRASREFPASGTTWKGMLEVSIDVFIVYCKNLVKQIKVTKNDQFSLGFFLIFYLLIFLFSPCVCLIFSEVFSAAWWWRVSREFSDSGTNGENYMPYVSSFCVLLFSCVCLGLCRSLIFFGLKYFQGFRLDGKQFTMVNIEGLIWGII